MSGQYVRTLTPGQARRRLARIARRRAAGHVYSAPMSARPKSRFSFKAFRARVQANKAAIARMITAIESRRAAWTRRVMTKARCPYQRVWMEQGKQMATYPCGGVLRAYRPHPKAEYVERCQTCGREWRWIGSELIQAVQS